MVRESSKNYKVLAWAEESPSASTISSHAAPSLMFYQKAVFLVCLLFFLVGAVKKSNVTCYGTSLEITECRLTFGFLRTLRAKVFLHISFKNYQPVQIKTQLMLYEKPNCLLINSPSIHEWHEIKYMRISIYTQGSSFKALHTCTPTFAITGIGQEYVTCSVVLALS